MKLRCLTDYYILWICILIVTFCESNDINQENLLPGTSGWYTRVPEDYTNVPLGFTTNMSYDINDDVQFKIDGSIDTPIVLEIYRLGFYQGHGARLITTIHTKIKKKQPLCAMNKVTRMVDCDNWYATASWNIPKDAVSGVYIGLPYYKNDTLLKGPYIPFVIKNSNPNSKADILFKTSDTTWVAYNLYGGYNLYRGNGSFNISSRAYEVSYNRPFTNRLPKPKGKVQNFLFGSEYSMLYFLEKYGYNIHYAACQDIEQWSADKYQLLRRYKTLLSVGHDEYWTADMKEAYVNVRDYGVNLVFFSGNEIYWRVRWATKNQQEHNSDKRTLICHKETLDGGLVKNYNKKSLIEINSDWTGTFMDARYGHIPQPPNGVTGQLFMVNAHRQDAMKVHHNHGKLRLWRNTPAASHNPTTKHSFYVTTKGILGYEWDILPESCHNRPPGLFALSHTPMYLRGYLLENYGASYKGSGFVSHKLSLYRHYSKYGNNITALIFGAGTVQWSWGLSNHHDFDKDDEKIYTEDFLIQQATVNLFADMNILPTTLTVTDSNTIAFHERNGSLPSPQSKLILNKLPLQSTNPVSIITSPKNYDTVYINKFRQIIVKGTAYGRIGGVELSLDDGLSWISANGAENWHLNIHIHGRDVKGIHMMHHVSLADVNCSNYMTSKINEIHKMVNGNRNDSIKLHIISRAIDDNGWLESNRTSFNDIHIQLKRIE